MNESYESIGDKIYKLIDLINETADELNQIDKKRDKDGNKVNLYKAKKYEIFDLAINLHKIVFCAINRMIDRSDQQLSRDERE